MTNNFIKKYLLFLLPFLLVFSLSSPAFAGQTLAEQEEALQNIEEIECGVVSESGTDVVAPRSFSLCKEDITYNAFYYMFAEIFNDNDMLKRMLFEGDRDVFSNVAADASGISGPVMTVLSAVTYLVFIIASIILSYVTIKYLYRTATSGEFGGNWHSVWVPLRSLLAIMLIAPIGGVSIVQVIVMIAALIGAGLGNYLWGAFLNKFQMDAFIEGSENKINRDLAYSQANTLVETQLCMDRTKKAVKKSNFSNTDDRGTPLIDPYDLNDHVRMLTECTDEGIYYSKNGHSIKEGAVRNIELKNTNTCANYSFVDSMMFEQTGYEAEVYGENYNCGFLRFNNPEPINVVTDDSAVDMATDDNFLTDAIVYNGGFDLNSFEYADDLTNDFSSKLQPFVQNVLSNVNHQNILSSLNVIAEEQVLQGEDIEYNSPEVQAIIEALKGQMVGNGEEIYEELNLATNQSSAVKGIYVAYAIILNNLLGAKAKTVGDEHLERNQDRTFEIPVYYDTNAYIYRDFQKYTKESSLFLQTIHCLRNFSEYRDLISNNEMMNYSITDDLTYDGWVKYMGDFGNVNFECSEFYFEGNDPTNENVRVTTLLERTGDPDLISLVNDFDPNDPADVEILNTQIKTKGLEYLKKAEAEKETVSLWFYVVRQATEKAYSEVLKESIDTSVPINMRKQGFPTAGGYMLTIALNQVNASSLLSSIRTGVQWGSNVDGESGLYYNPSFNSNIEGDLPLEEINSNGVEFSPLKISGFFSGQTLSSSNIEGINNSDGTTNESVSQIFDDVLKGIRNYVLAPTDHLKRAAGIPQEISLKDGIEECYTEGNCATGDVHPMNALIFLGNDLIEVSVIMIVTTFVVNKLAQALDGETGSKGKMSGGKKGNLESLISTVVSYIPFVKGLSLVLSLASMVLKIFYPLWVALFVAGIFLAYVLPTIPFIAFLLVYIGWIILALELLIAAPIWLLLLAVPDQNGAGRASGMEVWNFFGLLIMKPAFMVIALAFAWFLASVSVFIVNSTIFSVFAPADESSSGMIMSIINFVLFYVVYVVIVVIALLQAFKLISLLPDQMSKWINVRQSNDSNVVDSVGSDHLLQAILVREGVGKVQGGLENFSGDIDQRIGRRKQQVRDSEIRRKLNDIYEDDTRHQRNNRNEDLSGKGKNDSGQESSGGGATAPVDATKEALEKANNDAYGSEPKPSGRSSDEIIDMEDPAERGSGSSGGDGDEKK